MNNRIIESEDVDTNDISFKDVDIKDAGRNGRGGPNFFIKRGKLSMSLRISFRLLGFLFALAYALPMDDRKPAAQADPFGLSMMDFIDTYYESYDSELNGNTPLLSPDHEFFRHLPSSLMEPPKDENMDLVHEEMDFPKIVTPEQVFYAPSSKKKVEQRNAPVVFLSINDTTTISDLFHEFGFGYNGGRALVKVAEEETNQERFCSRDHTHTYEMCIRYI
jgi:hypothetical protein